MTQDMKVDGAPATVTYVPEGGGASERPVRAKLHEMGGGAITDYGAAWNWSGEPVGPAGPDDTAAFHAAFNYLNGSRSHFVGPDPSNYYGLGRILLPKGYFTFAPISFGLSNQFGLSITGAGAYSSTAAFNLNTGSAFLFKAYNQLRLEDLTIKNNSASAGSSVAIDLNGDGGGGYLTVENTTITGFGTAVRTNGTKNDDGSHNPGNGDKTFFKCVEFNTAVAFDQTRNNQAYGWTFLNCSGGCPDTHFKMGGAGETLITNYTGNVYGSFIKLPESSGNPGGAAIDGGNSHYFGQNLTVTSTKLEYHGAGDRMLLDARDSRRLTGDVSVLQKDRGSHATITFRDVSIASGNDWPNPDTHTIIQVGDAATGTDALRVRQFGGWIEGILKLGSPPAGNPQFRWMFHDAVRAPNPATVQFLGAGNHYLLEWSGNENVPLDQYRGGQGAALSIDSQKSYLLPISGRYLVDTRAASQQRVFNGRVGADHVITLPNTSRQSGLMGGQSHATVGQVGLRVYTNTAPATDTQVTQFTDGTFTTPIGSTVTIPTGQTGKGLFVVHASLNNVQDGKIYIRVAKPAVNQVTEGRLVIDYFPYLGT